MVNEMATNPQHLDATPSVKDEIEEIGETICNFPSCDKSRWAPYDFCGNTHAMMTGAKAIDICYKEKGIEQTHTWDNMTKTCTPIVYSQTATESDDTVQIGDGEEAKHHTTPEKENEK
jgi:hypothetical protein